MKTDEDNQSMKTFISDNFVLETKTFQDLYHNYVKYLPIIDYHCHLDPKLIAEDSQFDNIGELWLGGDHKQTIEL